MFLVLFALFLFSIVFLEREREETETERQKEKERAYSGIDESWRRREHLGRTGGWKKSQIMLYKEISKTKQNKRLWLHSHSF